MTEAEAYQRALNALSAADDEQYKAFESRNSGWGSSTSDEIFNHIDSFLQAEFGITEKPDPKHSYFGKDE